MADSLNSSVPSLARANGSAWDPLREPLFRSLWLAAVISYTGTWMQNVGAGWLMTQLTLSPFMVGLVQAATTLPVFLVILPAGANDPGFPLVMTSICLRVANSRLFAVRHPLPFYTQRYVNRQLWIVWAGVA